MAFADSIRTATYTREELADLIDELHDFSDSKDVQSAISGTITSSTSSSAVDLDTTELAFTVPSGEEYLLRYESLINYTHSSTGIGTNYFLLLNGVSTVQQTILSPTAGASGNLFSVYLYYNLIATAGTYTFKVQWSASSGTRYSLRRYSQLTRQRLI